MLKLLIFTILALFTMFGAASANAQYAEKISDPSLALHPPKYLPKTISEPFDLKFNQGAMITFDNILVIFSNVTSDSRCPSDVTCIWQGEIRIQVDVKKEDAAFESIMLGENGKVPIFGKYFIQLLKVEPYPQSTHKIQSDEYVATFLITKINPDRVLPPLRQFKSGITIDKIQCKENLQLVIKTSNDNPVCVKPATKVKLIERGWASNLTGKGNTLTSHMSQTYDLNVGDQVFKIVSSISGGTLLRIEPDIQAKSLIIQLEASDDGEIKISFSQDLIDAWIGNLGKKSENGSFFVLVNGAEADYKESQDQVQRTLVIPFDSGSKQIEIIGM